MTLGIVVSLPRELRSLTDQPIPMGAWKAISDNILVVVSGIGAERAYAAGTLLVSQGARALLSWGCSAARNGRVPPGCLVFTKRIIILNGEINLVSTEWHQRLYRTLESK